jgi:hypothetical protein
MAKHNMDKYTNTTKATYNKHKYKHDTKHNIDIDMDKTFTKSESD